MVGRVVVLMLLATAIASQQLHRIPLDKWEFKVAGKFEDKYYSANVPSTVHLDLLNHSLIKDPFYKTQVNEVTWLANAGVVYRTTFDKPAELAVEAAELVFEGLDTYATVVLNGQEIALTNNAFVKHCLPLKWKSGSNTLEVHFSQSPNRDESDQASIERLPFAYGHTRKAAYQHGWDWAPNLVTVGIWRPVYILCNTTTRLDYVWIRNKVLAPEEATLNVAVVLTSQQKHFDNQIAIEVDGSLFGTWNITEEVDYHDITIKQPKYWWPRNVGNPNVYNITIKLLDKQGLQVIDVLHQIYGIRTVELNTTDGGFQFIVNGHPVYAKGANYVPPDMFHPRFTNPAFKPGFSLEQYMDTIVDSNYNMIRVWGGGQYETNEFYEELTKRGIMAFHDFMFSVNIYPGHEKFLRNCELELKQQIRRLRNYACIALWSGNNEILQGIKEWGWGAASYTKNYDLLFEKLLPKILSIESPDISYIPSSPQFGSGFSGRTGDIHSWSVWAGGSLFDNYQQYVGRFNSEFGTQALPVYETVLSFAGAEELRYESPVLLYHEKHGSQFNTLKSYMNTYMNKSTNFENEVYQSSLVQAFGVGVAIQAHRVKRPDCWGTLYWQFNDAWPGISWASMDYYGRWKALQYRAKQLYTDVALMWRGRDDVFATVVNDKLFQADCLLTLIILTTDGKVLFNETTSFIVKSNEAHEVMKFSRTKIGELGNNNTKNLVFFGQLITGKNSTMRNTHHVVYHKELELAKAKLTVKYDLTNNTISLRSDVFVKNLLIDLTGGKYLKLSDNYFDIVPGFPVIVKVEGNLSELKGSLQYKSYRESYNGDKLEVQVEE